MRLGRTQGSGDLRGSGEQQVAAMVDYLQAAARGRHGGGTRDGGWTGEGADLRGEVSKVGDKVARP